MILKLQIVSDDIAADTLKSCTNELSLLCSIWSCHLTIPDRHDKGEFLISFEGLSEYRTCQALNILASYCEIKQINCEFVP